MSTGSAGYPQGAGNDPARTTIVRAAGPTDAPEIVRLRCVMLGLPDAPDGPRPQWQHLAEARLRAGLGDPAASLAAFVVDRVDLSPGSRPSSPDQAKQLAACAVGVIEHRLGGPGNPTGDIGYILNVATDPGYRRRGYARACLTALLGWYREREVPVVDLRATPDGQALYRSLGFAPTTAQAMRLSLAGPPSTGCSQRPPGSSTAAP